MKIANRKIEIAVVFLYLFLNIAFHSHKAILIVDIAIVLYFLIGKTRKQKLKSIGFRKPVNWLKTILICLFLGIAIDLCFDIFIDPLLNKIIIQPNDTSYDYMRGSLPDYLMMIIVGWVIGGFIEEIIFRGFLITRLSSLFKTTWIGNLIAIVVSSASFGFAHLFYGWGGVISTGLTGIIFGLIFIKSNKILWYSILIHGFYDATCSTLIFLNLDKEICNLIFK